MFEDKEIVLLAKYPVGSFMPLPEYYIVIRTEELNGFVYDWGYIDMLLINNQ